MTRARYRPTYTLSATTRPLVHRLTPLAWICLALAILALAAAISLLAQQPGASARATPAVLGPGSTAPAATPAPPRPTMGTGTPAIPNAAPPYAPWAAGMKRLADGQISAPVEASQTAREAVRRALEQELALGRSELRGAEALAAQRALLRATRTGVYLMLGEQAIRGDSLEVSWQALTQGVIERISIFAFSPDGLECDALVTLRDTRFTLFDGRGQAVAGDARKDGLWRYRLRYDLAAAGWKLADLLEFAPAQIATDGSR